MCNRKGGDASSVAFENREIILASKCSARGKKKRGKKRERGPL